MLLSAVEQQDLDSVQALIITENLDETNNQGLTSLCLASKLGSTAIVETLLKAGAKVNLQNHVKFTQ